MTQSDGSDRTSSAEGEDKALDATIDIERGNDIAGRVSSSS
jgi:hypothetical protein